MTQASLSDGRIAQTLEWLLDALPAGAFVGAARSDGRGGLEVIEAGAKAALDGLLLGPVLADGCADWVDVCGCRLSTAWTLALGARPAFVSTARVRGTPWFLVAAVPPQPASRDGAASAADRHEVLMIALRLLAEAHHAGTRTRAESRQRARVEALVRTLATPIVYLDFQSGEALVNQAAESLLALDLEPRTLVGVVQAMRALAGESGLLGLGTASGEKTSSGSLEIERQDRVWLVQSRRVEDETQFGRLWQFTDITAQRRRERALVEGARARTVARLAGLIAHEFNNLLTVVLGNAEVVSDDPTLSPNSRRRMFDLTQAAERGAELVAQLTAYASAPAGERLDVELGAELRRLVPLIQRAMPARIELDFRCECGPLRANCEPAVLADALMQLALNARDAMPAGGRVEISLSAAAGGLARVCVRDSGTGMAPEVLEQAREPFFSTKGLANGRGLGLAMVDNFARRHAGELRIASAPGQGTTVDLLLPAREAPASDVD